MKGRRANWATMETFIHCLILQNTVETIWPGDTSPLCSEKNDSLWAPVCMIPYPQNGIGSMERNPDGSRLKQARGSVPQMTRNRGEAGQDCNSCSRDQAVSLFLHAAFIHWAARCTPLWSTHPGSFQEGRREMPKGISWVRSIGKNEFCRKPHPTSASNSSVRTMLRGHLLL